MKDQRDELREWDTADSPPLEKLQPLPPREAETPLAGETGLRSEEEPSHSPAQATPAAGATPARRSLAGRAMLYPDIYVWYVFFAALDIMLTWVILHFEGGREINPLADWIIRNSGLRGVVAFKFGIVMFVIAICEIVGYRSPRTGRKLALAAAVLTALPVAVALGLLVADVYAWVMS